LMVSLRESIRVWTIRLACEARNSFSGFFQRERFVRCWEKKAEKRVLMIGSANVQWKVSVPSSSVATCSDLFVENGRTINGKAGGVTIRLITRQLSY